MNGKAGKTHPDLRGIVFGEKYFNWKKVRLRLQYFYWVIVGMEKCTENLFGKGNIMRKNNLLVILKITF